jgi:hypothetical protein
VSYFNDQAQKFLQMASDLEERLSNEGSTLNAGTYASLDQQREDLQDRADDMVAADMKGTLAGLKVNEARVSQCTTDLQNAVKTVQRFDKIAAIVAASLTLAKAIVSADPGQIFDALEGAEKAVADVVPQVKKAVDKLDLAASGDASGS